jgi:thioredoxin reductase/Pyruvate/2-oxoacid:ferredoxin oxidoreductase delta subunit
LSWTFLIGLAAVLAITLALLLEREREWERMASVLEDRTRARKRGSHKGRLHVPHIDLTRCLGCGTCVRACPEEQVLDISHGQATVLHGSRCVGHAKCAEECPVDAITVTVADLDKRRDIPALDEGFGVPGRPGLYLAGEVTGFALIRTAIAQGKAVAGEIARSLETESAPAGCEAVLDLCIVGAGPAGLSCSLAAREAGLSFTTIDQASLGGTVSTYPRRKLVLTQPVDFPLGGRLKSSEYSKEELMEYWSKMAREHELPIREGVAMCGLRFEDGIYRIDTSVGELVARRVVLAIGRRGTPRKLGVPGEDLPKVAYSLLDARSYAGRRVLVVGGGDSAIEAALALSEQQGCRTSLSYRRDGFSRLKAKNERKLEEAIASGRIDAKLRTVLSSIEADRVQLADASDASLNCETIGNDDVFIFAGGDPPFPMLESAGVSFDPKDRQLSDSPTERGTGVIPALALALVTAATGLGFALYNRGYYGLPLSRRPVHDAHDWLAPGATVGVLFGVAATLLLVANLVYLLRRSTRVPLTVGSLSAWMTAHVGTGIGALVLANLHAAMSPRDSMGGHALLGMLLLVLTGAIGRYFYAFLPRAANGRELEFDEVQAELAAVSAEWDRGHRSSSATILDESLAAITEKNWTHSLTGRIRGLLQRGRMERRLAQEVTQRAAAAELGRDQVRALVALARRASRARLAATHLEDMRALLASWRYFHRWGALLVVLLVIVHVISAYLYGGIRGL